MYSVDVIIPLHNKGPYVEQAVRSVINQTYPIAAILVADDCSNDDGPEIVRRMALVDHRVRLVPYDGAAPTGPSAARNRAIRAGLSEFVAMLDADDWWDPQKLQKQMEKFASGEISLCHCLYDLVDESGRAVHRVLHDLPATNGRILDAARLGSYAVTGSASAVVARRAHIEQAGLFPEHLRFGEDWALWAELARFGEFACLPEELVHIRLISSTHSRSIDASSRFLANLEVWRIWENEPKYLRIAIPYVRRQLVLTQFHLMRTPQQIPLLLALLRTGNRGQIASAVSKSRLQYYGSMVTLIPFIVSKAWRRAAKVLAPWLR